jgi:BMFP domain-containing protein YqiC
MTTTQNTSRTEELTYCIAKATENIAKAVKLGRKDIAQQIRRERRGYIAKLDAVTA